MFELVGIQGDLFAIRDTDDYVIDILPASKICRCLNLGLNIGGVSKVSDDEFEHTDEFFPKVSDSCIDLSTLNADCDSIKLVLSNVLNTGVLDDCSEDCIRQLYDDVCSNDDFYVDEITGTLGQVLEDGDIDNDSQEKLSKLYQLFVNELDSSTDDSEDAFDGGYSDGEGYQEEYQEDSEEDCEDDEAFDDGYSDEDFGEVEEEVSTVNKLYKHLNEEQIKLLKRYYLWFSQRIFDEGKQKARTLQVTNNPRKLQKQKELNIMRNNGGMWAYAGFIDMGYRGADYCTLGHPLRYVHLAWDISVSDIETSFFGEEYNNDIEDVINSSNCIKFGIDCISDFFEINKEYTDKLKRAQREAIKDMDFMCSYYEDNCSQEVIDSFTITDEIVNNIVKVDAKGLMLDKDYKCLVPKSLSAFYRQFRQLGMIVPKSLIQEIRDNLIGWESHKFIGFKYPNWTKLNKVILSVVGKSAESLNPAIARYSFTTYAEKINDYLVNFFELKSCGYYEFDADIFKDEGGASKPVKQQLYTLKSSVTKHFWSDYEYTFAFIKRLSTFNSTVLGLKDIVSSYSTCREVFRMNTNRYELDEKDLSLDYDMLKHYDEEFETDLYTIIDDLKNIQRLSVRMCKKSYNECYSLSEVQDSLNKKIEVAVAELPKYKSYVSNILNTRVSEYNQKKIDEENKMRAEEEERERKLEEKRLAEEEAKKKELEEADNSSEKLSDDEIVEYCYKNKAKVKGVAKLKFPLTVLDTVHKTSKHSPKQMLYILKVYAELTGIVIESDAKPQKTSLDDRKDIEDAIDKVLADPDLLENTEDMEKVYAILTSIKKYRTISERQMKYADIALNLTNN